MDPESLFAGRKSQFEMGKIGGLVDIDFSTREGQRDQRAGRLHEQGARAFVAAESKQIRINLAGKDGGDAHPPAHDPRSAPTGHPVFPVLG